MCALIRAALCCAHIVVGSAIAAEHQVPKTHLLLKAPDDLLVKPLNPATPNILLHCEDAGSNRMLQVVGATAGASTASMAAEYEKLMANALPGLQQVASETRKIAVTEVLHRKYKVSAGGNAIVVEAVFVPDQNAAVVVHTISTAAGEAEMHEALMSLNPPGQSAVVAGSPAAPAADGSIRVGETDFHVMLPAGWQRQQGADGSLTMTSADQNAAVHLFGSAIPADVALIDQLMAEMFNPLLGDGWKQVSKASSEKDGQIRREMEFSRILDGAEARHQIVVEHQNGQLIAINAVYHRNVAADHAAVAKLIASLHHGVMAAPQAAVTQATPNQQPGPAADGRNYQWFTEQQTNTAWRIPVGWKIQKIDGNIYILPHEGDPLYDSGGVRIQIVDRKSPEYKDNATAVRKLMQFATDNQATILDNQSRPVGALNCHFNEFSVTLAGTPHHMFFAHVERPDTLCIIQYDVEGDVRQLRKLTDSMRPAFHAAASTLREGDGR